MADGLAYLLRVIWYLATAMLIGGQFIRQFALLPSGLAPRIWRYQWLGAALGIVAVMLTAANQLWQFSAQGWAGLLDWPMLQMLLGSAMGHSWLLALSGFVSCWLILNWCKTLTGFMPQVLFWLATILVVGAFSQSGHLSEGDWIGKLTLLLHIYAMALWIGALYPLWLVTKSAKLPQVQALMLRFGQLAQVIVVVLLLCGGLMIWWLLGSLDLLFSSAYGQTLLIKLALVVGLLLLAATNKFRLVPMLVPKLNQQGASPLRRAIVLEMILALLILAFTAWLTQVVGLTQR